MKLSFTSSAQRELDEAIEYYNDRLSGLGWDLASEVETAGQRIAKDPTSLPIFDDETRICRTKRFPYGLIFDLDENEIRVIAVAHLHRKSDYWKKRRQD